jgi:hypothetical protein
MSDGHIAQGPRKRRSLSTKISRQPPKCDDPALLFAHPAIRWIEYECPACGWLLILADAITELANHGRLHLTGTDTSRIDALDAVSAHLSTLAPTRAG